MTCIGIWRVLTRRKVLDENSMEKSPLGRVLTIGDLTALGVGSTLGVGVYVLAGHVAKESAGPSVVISFLLAAIASIFAGLCYAEFGARIPRAGSAYIYSYVCVGEFIAFIIGWNLILEYVIGSASVSRGISLYLDSLLNNILKNCFKEALPIASPLFSDYFDIFACGLAVLIGLGLAFGLKESSLVNNIFTVVNIFIVIFVIGAGAFQADVDNWNIDKTNSSSSEIGEGGFFPFGFSGTLKGAATCFFGFVGFDCIATTGEEVQNPKKALPISIAFSLLIIFLSYFGISAILTLMVAFNDLNSDAPIPYAFEEVGWVWAKWIVAIGGIFGLFASLFGSMFPLPRILYAMASDGLIFHFLGSVNSKFKTPIFGTILASLITGVMAGLFDLKNLVNMMSIGTLMAYTIVAACVLLLRYNYDESYIHKPDEYCSLLHDKSGDENDSSQVCEPNIVYHGKMMQQVHELQYECENRSSNENFESFCINKKSNYSFNEIIRQLFTCHFNKNPTVLSSVIVGVLIITYFIFCFCFGLCLLYTWDELLNGTIWSIIITSIFGCLMVITVILLSLQPKNNTILVFQVPLVPFLPALSIFINICLMLMLDANTWIRFGIWMAIGIPVYMISLYIYDRGANYIPYAQKSSVNGNMKGNSNYAFEDLDECRERGSFSDCTTKMNVHPPLDIEKDILVNETIENFPQNTSEDYPINSTKNEKLDHVFNENIDIKDSSDKNKNIGENIEESLDYGEKVIGLLDQVLKDEEEASGELINDSFEINDTINLSYPLRLSQQEDEYFSIQETTIESINHDSVSDKISVHNVIAIVHREDEVLVDDSPEKANENISSVEIVEPPSSEILEENSPETVDENISIVEIVEPYSSEFLEEKKDDNEIHAHISESSENVTKIELDVPSENFIIPKPPPMDESLFTTPIIPFKSKTVNFKKEKSENYKKIQEFQVPDSSVDDSAIKPGNEFFKKLSGIYGNYATNPQLMKQRRLTKGVLKEPSINDSKEPEKSNELKKNNSEPNLNKMLQLNLLNESLKNKLLLENQESSITKTINNSPVKKNNSNVDNQSQGVNQINEKENFSYDHNDQPKSKAEIKKMLESVIGKPKIKQIAPIILKENAVHENDSELVVEKEIIQPKVKENFSRTMKLQRARFEDVLKSIQQSQNRDETHKGENNEINHTTLNNQFSEKINDSSVIKTSES